VLMLKSAAHKQRKNSQGVKSVPMAIEKRAFGVGVWRWTDLRRKKVSRVQPARPGHASHWMVQPLWA